MKAQNFETFQTVLHRRSGLVLTSDKAYLLESRLMPVARKWNLKNLDDMAVAIKIDGKEDLLKDVAEAMTTNESFFFRDTKPFDQFRTIVLPKMLAARSSARRLRIWSAACSSGQEPYSLAMILVDEASKLMGWNIEIVATDLSSKILEKARAGIYTQFEVQRGLPIQYMVKHFEQHGDKWQINENLRRMVKFREFNLLESLSSLGKFDVVFCRNVLIYFDQPTKTRVLRSISDVLAPDGTLYLGGAETVLGISQDFKPMDNQRGMYELTKGDAAKPQSIRLASAAAV